MLNNAKILLGSVGLGLGYLGKKLYDEWKKYTAPTKCNSCKKEYPFFDLQKCPKCHKLSCKNCIQNAPTTTYSNLNSYSILCKTCHENLDHKKIAKYFESIKKADEMKHHGVGYLGKNHLKNHEAGPSIHTKPHRKKEDALLEAKISALLDDYTMLDKVDYQEYSESITTSSGGTYIYKKYSCSAIPYRELS